MWQNAVLTMASVVFIVSLFPTVLDPAARVPMATSTLTAAMLLIMAGTTWTLKLRATAASQVVLGALWAFIAVFRSA